MSQLGKISPSFDKLLETFSFSELETSRNSIFGLWSDFTLGYFNPGWVKFARDNEGPQELASEEYLGTSVVDICGDELAPFYLNLFESCLSGDSDGPHPIQHEYECSSPDYYRNYLMTLYPLGNNEGLLVANALIIETEHGDRKGKIYPANRSEYVDDNEIIRQCSHCRKVQHRELNRWDWVPKWVRKAPPETSHTICPVCLDHYYPDTPDDDH